MVMGVDSIYFLTIGGQRLHIPPLFLFLFSCSGSCSGSFSSQRRTGPLLPVSMKHGCLIRILKRC